MSLGSALLVSSQLASCSSSDDDTKRVSSLGITPYLAFITVHLGWFQHPFLKGYFWISTTVMLQTVNNCRISTDVYQSNAFRLQE